MLEGVPASCCNPSLSLHATKADHMTSGSICGREWAAMCTAPSVQQLTHTTLSGRNNPGLN
eukprot:8038000-Alexandrium_andersonii.AAC.1